jgi:pimeloyl-ACP methyl ester carboxylesterase
MTRPLPHVEGVEHGYERVRGVELHVAEAGEGPPVVLLHGWPQHWYEWRHLIPPLAKEHHVVCPDLRGFGWSEATPSGYDKETLAHDVLALLDQRGIQRFSLAGHDWGGWVGFLIALLVPDRVDRLLAMNIAHPFTKATPAALAQQWRFWYQPLLGAPILGPRLVRRMAGGVETVLRWAGADSAWNEDETRTFLSQLAEPARAHASMKLYRAAQLRDIPAAVLGRYRRMAPLRPPTLLLYGVEDHIIRPVHFAHHTRYARDMRVELVPGCGHFIADERPDLVVDRALAFFAPHRSAHRSRPGERV